MKTPVLRRVVRTLVVALAWATVATAHGAEPKSLRDMKVFRFEFDNDLMLGSDDAFTAGWSAQVHSALLDQWPRALQGWIGRVPTLGDDGEGGRIVRWSWGITQLMMTPRDLTIAAPQPDDVPWAGMLGGYLSWSAYDNRRLAALQVYVGCIGPCAHAENAQKFVHETLSFGDSPKGWANQTDDDVL
ncbi:MAG TPA: lipid A-modifier LpxR family protein, partial [Gammaproteobacteria bacterium]|nr:lipid A-modifier LpxR family protein [Gammaproteobacteria bacterium]